MPWPIIFCVEFEAEVLQADQLFKEQLAVHLGLLRDIGPLLGRPRVDTLKGSRHCNLKELRFSSDGRVWRVAFAFDPDRCAVLLIAGDKAGVHQERFYQRLIALADERYDRYLAGGVEK
ncbi:type II toxin-antitoxin system RelE/ParE family toxin [Pseudomonas japonica]|uniref:Addiction module toxin RelE n=1 Tax=Pseudomonas japonica TaxID=256466 RepID=A0A239D1C1_9PSED|nr:type II toxin-antitoxin system RelE/ParE family toxin [Pseudomonas japonica]SNS26130.1 hypothetical protein SAMN05444352_105174 [Pseudomonas japonica]